jgi:phenylpyruvate tautomerase PptA (4-oxalocrotonate tautomerase family)
MPPDLVLSFAVASVKPQAAVHGSAAFLYTKSWNTMPLTRVTTNFSLGQRKAELADRLHQVMVEVVKTIKHARWIMIDERPGDFFFPPLNSSGNFAIIEVSFFPGRSLDTKTPALPKNYWRVRPNSGWRRTTPAS